MIYSPTDRQRLMLEGEVELVKSASVGPIDIVMLKLLRRSNGEPRECRDYFVGIYRDGVPISTSVQGPNYISMCEWFDGYVTGRRKAAAEELAGRVGVEREARPGTAKALFERYGAVGKGNRRRGRKSRAA
jgi:hypothetical protein